MDDDALLEGLDERQHLAVTHPARTLAVEAGAGSGKTRVLTRRIAHRAAAGDLDPRRVLAITFTRKAAGELTSRLRALGLRDAVTAGTFHSVAYGQLRTRWSDRGIDPPKLLEGKIGFVARLLPVDAAVSPVDVSAEIEWAKARMVSPDQYEVAANADGRRPPVDLATMTELFERYERDKRRRRMVDFDDLLRLCCHDLHNDREFAAAQHWRHRHVFVDEFQDINPLQFALLQAWLGPRDDLCVVGDPNQAIYGWNGADAHYLSDLDDYFPEVERVVLDRNYRSSNEILVAARAVLHGATGPASITTDTGPPPTIRSFADDVAEAAGVARAVRDRHGPGTRWSSQAVLVRTHHQAVALHDALTRGGIPCRMRGSAPSNDRSDRDGGHPVDAVDICTFHAAKGLEWPVVHLAGLEQGLVPIGHARTPDAVDEERRLLYVAVTRARHHLSCSWAAQRTFGGHTRSREPSPWLLDIERAFGESPIAPPTPGRPLLRSVPAESGVLDALRQWRASAARAAGVPASVVIHDRALVEVASRRPRTIDDLLEVPGIGPVKASRYGDALLGVVNR